MKKIHRCDHIPDDLYGGRIVSARVADAENGKGNAFIVRWLIELYSLCDAKIHVQKSYDSESDYERRMFNEDMSTLGLSRVSTRKDAEERCKEVLGMHVILKAWSQGAGAQRYYVKSRLRILRDSDGLRYAKTVGNAPPSPAVGNGPRAEAPAVPANRKPVPEPRPEARPQPRPEARVAVAHSRDEDSEAMCEDYSPSPPYGWDDECPEPPDDSSDDPSDDPVEEFPFFF